MIYWCEFTRELDFINFWNLNIKLSLPHHTHLLCFWLVYPARPWTSQSWTGWWSALLSCPEIVTFFLQFSSSTGVHDWFLPFLFFHSAYQFKIEHFCSISQLLRRRFRHISLRKINLLTLISVRKTLKNFFLFRQFVL